MYELYRICDVPSIITKMQLPLIKVSMLVVLVAIVLFCCLMTYNISSNRIVIRSYDDTYNYKNLLLNPINNSYSSQKIVENIQNKQHLPLSSTTTTINSLANHYQQKQSLTSTIAINSANIATLPKQPKDSLLLEKNDDQNAWTEAFNDDDFKDQQPTPLQQQQQQQQQQSSSSEPSSSTSASSSLFVPPEDIKRSLLSLLSDKVRKQQQYQQSKQQQNRPPSVSFFPNTNDNFPFQSPLNTFSEKNIPSEYSSVLNDHRSPNSPFLSFTPLSSKTFDWSFSPIEEPPKNDEPMPASSSSIFSLSSNNDDEFGDDNASLLANSNTYQSLVLDSLKTSISKITTESPLSLSSTTTSSTSLQSSSLFTSLKPLNLSSSSQNIAHLFNELTNNHYLDSRRFTNKDLHKNTNQLEIRPKQLFNRNGSCGKNVIITISTNYEISSPNYPNKYPPNTHCIWHIQSQKDQLLKVQIFKLHLESDRTCRFDRLDIKGVHQLDKKTGKTITLTKRFCGHYVKSNEFDIGANHTTIEFYSDSYSEYSGFHIRIIAQSKDCTNNIFVHNYSYITSPNYPESYDDLKNCWTLVNTRNDHRLLVNFLELYLEPGNHCEFDYVEIFDSTKAISSKSMGKFCTFPTKSKSKLHLYSTNNSLLFHFESDEFLALRGYKAKIVSLRNDVNISNYLECDWNADWKNMTISSPLFPEPYPVGSQCETSITAPTINERIILLFDWIDLVDADDYGFQETDNQQVPYFIEEIQLSKKSNRPFNCSRDRLEIYEKLNDTKPSNVFCGFRSQPFRYESQTDSIRLVFRSVHLAKDLSRKTGQNDRNSELFTVNHGFRAKFTFITVAESNLTTAANLFPTDNYSYTSSYAIMPTVQPANSNSLILIHRPENASIRLGSSHILYCEAKLTGNVDETKSLTIPIIWFKGDREIHDGVSENGTSLMIRQFSPKSVGRYICVFGDNSSDAWLTIKPDTPNCQSSSVLFRERPRDQFTSEGEFVMLHCSATLVDSHEDVEISWERVPLVNSHYHLNEHFVNNDIKPQPVIYNSRIKKLSRGDLLFDRVLVEDSGYYFCVARLNQRLMQETINNDTDSKENEDCVLKSVARVQINRRVDVRDYCGRISINANNAVKMEDVGKIIGGTEAQPGEFPWMVMLWDEKRHVFCGGALLNERWVVTAAHCFTDIIDESTVFVKLGKYDQTEAEVTEIVTKIQHTIKHPQFSNETFDNDIALVKLATHIQFTDNIRPICLATSTEVRQMNSYFFSKDYQLNENGQTNVPNESDVEIQATKFGLVTGWGRLKENGPLPRYLHKIRLPIVDRVKCRQSTTFKVTDNMFCAGYGKEIVGDACKGDSGGPFVVEFHSRWTLLGIVSWGEGCGRPEKFGYYTKVNNYDNWIRRLTALH